MAQRAQQLYDAGRLADAVKAQIEEVRARPQDVEARFLLFSLLAFEGDLERAARQLEALGAVARQGAVEMRTLVCRGLLAAEAERREIWQGRARPLLAPDAGPALGLRADALGRLAAGDAGGASRCLDESNACLTPVAGKLDQRAFTQIRDTDDFAAPFVEVFAQGRCLWLGFEQIRRLELSPPESILDLLWAPARLLDARGNEANVFLPALYAGTQADSDDRLRLGRMTEWRDESGIAARGVGQKVWLTASGADEQEWSLLDVRALEVGT
jgi:type VI secretion system protein ImpE